MQSKRKLQTASLMVALLVWQSLAEVIENSLFLPPPTQVFLAFYHALAGGELTRDITVSIYHFTLGLSLGALVGIPIGAAMGWFKTLDSLIDPLIELLRPIPPIAWIPFAIIWLHLTHYAAGFIVFMGTVFPILLNTYSGFRETPRILVESAKVLGCTTPPALIRRVAFPSALPSIATGIRIAMGVGWMCVVAAELFGVSRNGLGYKIWRYTDLHQMDSVLAYMLTLGLISLALDHAFRHLIEEKLLEWKTGLVITR